MHKPISVLSVFSPPSQKTYRSAVAKAIRTAKREYGLSNPELAEKLGCCALTVINALAEETDLNGVTLLRLWYHFGDEAFRPIIDISHNHAAEPLTVSDRFDDIERMLGTLRKVVEA
jgi:hypothetical protein